MRSGSPNVSPKNIALRELARFERAGTWLSPAVRRLAKKLGYVESLHDEGLDFVKTLGPLEIEVRYHVDHAEWNRHPETSKSEVSRLRSVVIRNGRFQKVASAAL